MEKNTNQFQDFLSGLVLAQAMDLKELQILPLVSEKPVEVPLKPLAEVLPSGQIEVEEVSHSGSVPEILVKNGSQFDVLILDGEELLGAKQNRIVNVTIIVAAMSKLIVPVTCVEAGRWGYRGRQFTSSPSYLYPSLRRGKHLDVMGSLKAGLGLRSDQGRVWGDISGKMRRMGTSSDSEAMADMMEQSLRREKPVEVKPKKGQVGYFAFIRQGFAGGDFFASPNLCSSSFGRMTTSYQFESMDKHIEFPQIDAEEIVEDVKSAEMKWLDVPGKGEHYRYRGKLVEGMLTVLDGVPVHVAVFAKEAN
jgi:hypothetical protein